MREKLHDFLRTLLKLNLLRDMESVMTKAELESLNLDLIALLTSVRDQIDDTLECLGANDDESDDDILENDSED